MLPYVWDLPDGKRIVVKCNKLGQPIGSEGGMLGQFLGTIARNGSYCPLNKKNWRKVKENKENKGDLIILQFVQTKFLYPHSCEKWILKSTGRNWRRFKLCPEVVEKDQWEALVNYWKSKKGKMLSEKNKRSRAMLKNTHSAGTKSDARWSEDLAELENLVEEQPELAQNDQGRVCGHCPRVMS
uniref:Uncharacterized protein n=1 Tax=Oryza punctata TaxID=4537 RepID=A0A0E0LIJ1_ORYPU